MEASFTRTLQGGSFDEADQLLHDLRKGQEEFEGEASVFPPLVEVHERIMGAGQWANYRQELERFIKDLEDILNSPKVRTAAANRLRFPDPGGTRHPDPEGVHAPDRVAERPKAELPVGGPGQPAQSDTPSGESALGRKLFAGSLVLAALILIGLVGLQGLGSCIGCGGTDPKDKSYAKTLSSGLKMGTLDANERIKIEDVKVKGSRATVTVSDDLTDAEARHLCNYTLDLSQAFSRSGGGGSGARSLLEAQVKRPGLFNDTRCER